MADVYRIYYCTAANAAAARQTFTDIGGGVCEGMLMCSIFAEGAADDSAPIGFISAGLIDETIAADLGSTGYELDQGV